MANLTILRTYALKDPAKLPASILFSHSDKTMAIYDAYPKSIFHFLVLPRVPPLPSGSTHTEDTPEGSTSTKVETSEITPNPLASDLTSLRTLLNSKNVTKEQAKEVVLSLKEEALNVKAEIEQEMEKRYGFVWDVWIGFHGVPSMEHVHLHVLSGDLCSEKMKNKKHYNSFHPKLGFFLHVDEVLSWFDAEPSYFQNMARLSPSEYEPLLKGRLSCFHCNSEKKNIPTLKEHLQEEWEKQRTRAETQKKRKLESGERQKQRNSSDPSSAPEEGGTSPAHKKAKTNTS